MKGTAKAIIVTICLSALFLLTPTLTAGMSPRTAVEPVLDQIRADQPELAQLIKSAKVATTYLRQSDTTFYWASNAWHNESRSIYTYGASNLLTGQLRQIWDGGAWIDTLKWTGTYDGSDRILTSLTQTYDDTGWTNVTLMTVVYDDILNTVEATTQTWSVSDGDWVNAVFNKYVLVDGLVDSLITKTWVTDAWVNAELKTYAYDADGLLTTLLVKTWSGSAWDNSARTKHYYEDNLDTLEVTEAYNADWDSLSQHQYSYDDMLNRVLDVYWEYDADSTLFYEKTNDTLKFDAGLLVQSVHYEVDADSLSRVRHTNHPANSYRLEDLYQYLDGATWTNIKRVGYCWTPALVVNVDGDHGQVPTNYSIAQNYPNPFNPETIIRYSLSQRSQVCISVYNVLGQEVATLVNETQSAGTYQTTWDGLDHAGRKASSGIYFYRINAGDFTETRKMVLLK